MLATNLQNMIESRAITTDYQTEFVDSDVYVRRFMDINEFRMVEIQAQLAYKDIVHLYNMGIMTINNMWDYVDNVYIDFTLEKAITYCIVDFYGYNNGIEYLFQHIYIDGANIPHINNIRNLVGYLNADYNSIIIDTGIDDYIYNDVKLIDAIASTVASTYHTFNVSDFLEYLNTTTVFDAVIETRADFTPNILNAQNEILEKYLQYDKYVAMYNIIDPANNLQTNIIEISEIVNLISEGAAIDLEMDVKKGFQFFKDGVTLKPLMEYDTAEDMISSFKNIDLDFDIRYKFVDDIITGNTSLEFDAVEPHIVHTTINTTNNVDDLESPVYIDKLFSMLPTISNLNLALINTKTNIKGKFSGIITNAFRQLADISDREALRLLNAEVLTFVGPNLIDPLSTNLIIESESVEEYLLNMKQDLLFGPINDFMTSLQNKLQGVSTINEVWNINLLQTFMDGVIPLINSTPDAHKINDDVLEVIYLRIVEDFAKITNSEGIKLINKIDIDLKVVLSAYICKDIMSDFNNRIIEFTFDYLHDLRDMFKVNYTLDDNFTNRIIIENQLKAIIDKLILPTFMQFVFGSQLTKPNAIGTLRYGSFTAIDKKYMQYSHLMSSVLNNDVSVITDGEYLATDASKLLEDNLQNVDYNNFNNQMQFIDTSSPDVVINYQAQKFWVKTESEYSNFVKPVLIGLDLIEVDFPIVTDFNLTIANRLKICSSDILRKNMDTVHTGTTALVSMFVEYSQRIDQYAIRPEVKKYYTDDFLREVNNLFYVDVINGLGSYNLFGKNYNIYLLNNNLNSIVFSRSCDFYKYVTTNPIVKIRNKDYVLLMSDAIELYNGSTYLFNSYKCVTSHNESTNKLILNQFKQNRSMLDDISLNIIDRDHRDLNLNVDAYEKYLALKYIINVDVTNALLATNLLSSLYSSEISAQLEVSTEYTLFHDMYGIHRS